jgi:hypothetical protein
MRLVGTIAIHLNGSLITRQPTFWEKLKQGLGGKVDLTTDRVKVELEATALVDQVRKALERLGVDNALSLVIDDTVIYQDTAGKPGDLPDLVIALSEHASIFGRGFKEMRFAAEREEAGLHLVIETVARTEHSAGKPSAIVSVGGRLRALEPRPGEAAEQYQQRVQPLVKDPTAFETARLQFESFVARLVGVLQTAMPEARVEEVRSEARLVKAPERAPAERPAAPLEPTHPAYDPFMVYYPSPMGMVLDAMIISSLMHSFAPSPAILVVNPVGQTLGSVDEVASDPGRLDDDYTAADVGGADDGAGSDDVAGADDDDAGGWDDGDGGGADDGGGGVDDGGGGVDDGGGGFDDGGGFDGGGGFGDD